MSKNKAGSGRSHSSPPVSEPSASSRGAWMALIAALLGWMFDGAEMGVFSLVGRSAMKDLMPNSPAGEQGLWFNVIMAAFLVGAATGGVVFGWLGDRIGRVRAMTLSVVTYAVFTGMCGLVVSELALGPVKIPGVVQLGVLRFIASLGMGGEWALGVALVMEVWPNRSRAYMAGLIGAAANVGYLLVGFVGLGLNNVTGALTNGLLSLGLSQSLVSSLMANDGWRVMMLLGTAPALLTFFIRVFVPESEKWEEEQSKGNTSHWAMQDLLGVAVGALGPALIVYLWAFDQPTFGVTPTLGLRMAGTIVGLAIATLGYTWPVIRYFQRLSATQAETNWKSTYGRMMFAACLSGVALVGTWGSTQQAAAWADSLTEAEYKLEYDSLVSAGRQADADALPKHTKRNAKEYTLIWLSVGAIVGTLLAAKSGDWLGRRPTYTLMCLASLGAALGLYLLNKQYGPLLLLWAFLAGAATASFYGWLPLYLPELFRTQVRATGQGFGFNFGRILAAVGALQVGNLMKLLSADFQFAGVTIPHGRPLACSLICVVYLVGMVIIWFGPETKGKPLPE